MASRHLSSPECDQYRRCCTGSRKNRLVLRLCKRSARKQRHSSRAFSKIFVQIDTEGMSSGLHSKTIEVHSNDPEHPSTTLKLKFNVIRNISIEPRSLGLSLSEWGKDAVFTLTATNSGT